MSTTGNDIRMYQKCLEKADNSHINLSLKGDNIVLTKRSDDTLYGYFENINDVMKFLCGFEWGYDRGVAYQIRANYACQEIINDELAELDEYNSCEEHF